jgi:hypothetical protein
VDFKKYDLLSFNLLMSYFKLLKKNQEHSMN